MDSHIRTTSGRVQHTDRRRENPLYEQASAEETLNVILAAEKSVKSNLGHKTRKEGRWETKSRNKREEGNKWPYSDILSPSPGRYMQTHQVTAIYTNRLEAVVGDTTCVRASQKVNCKIFSLKAHTVVFEGECHLAAHCLCYHTAHPPTTAVIGGITYDISELHSR